MRRLAVNPSVGVRRQLPLHKGAVFAFLHRTCLARQRSLAVRTPDPPCAKGGQHGAAMQGGLRSGLHHFAWLCCPARQRNMPPQAYSPWLSALGAWVVRLRREGPGCSLSKMRKKKLSFQRRASFIKANSIAWRGSAVWVQRHAGTLARRRGLSRWPRTKLRGTLSPAFSEDRPGEWSFSPDFPGRWPASA